MPPATFTIAATPNTPSIDERTTGVKVTLATLNATYAGGASVNGATYTIAAPAVHPFMIEGNELVIPAGASLDYEATQSYTLTIAANVAGSTTSPIPVTVNVGNIDDENPVFDNSTIPTNATVAAGTTTLIPAIDIDATDDFTTIANASDPETEISYAFVDGAQLTQTLEGFTINSSTGEITVASAPTFSTAPTDNMRTLTIRATDISSGVSGQIAEIDINIEVIFVVDSDGDGLIDINTLDDLNNTRYNLLGTSYKTSTSDPGDTTGCPEDVCRGYELMRDLDFADSASYAGDSINQAWRPEGGDPALAPNPGWVPIIGALGQIFNTIFEGNGHTIANLYNSDPFNCGLFAYTGENASIRAVGIIDGNVYCINSISAGGLLVTENSGGTITASYATGKIEALGGSSLVGGLVGSMKKTEQLSPVTRP